jgi:4-amino-4-deoxychorismate lyase
MSAIIAARLSGRPVDALPLDTRGLHYGDGIFRTLLLADGAIDDRDGQLEHLAADAARLALDVPATLAADLDALIAGHREGVVKLVLWRAAAGRGYAPATGAAESLALLYPPMTVVSGRHEHGIVAMRSLVTLGAQPLLAGIKHLNRLEQVLASREWPAGVDEAILGDEHDHPICGTRSNLFWVVRGVLHTPELGRCGVAGRMRARLLETAARLGVSIEIASHRWAALLAADEAFVSNSLIGVWPLRAIDARDYGAPGPVARALASALCHRRL